MVQLGARCPRCDGHMMPTYHEMVCSTCGYIEWGSTRSNPKGGTDSNGNVTPKKASSKAPPLQPAWALFGYDEHFNSFLCQWYVSCNRAVNQNEAYCREHRSEFVSLWGTQAPSWSGMSTPSRLGVAFIEYEHERGKCPAAQASGLFLPEAVGGPTHSNITKCRVYNRIRKVLEKAIGLEIKFWRDAVEHREYYTGGQPWNLRLPPDWRDTLGINQKLRLDRSAP